MSFVERSDNAVHRPLPNSWSRTRKPDGRYSGHEVRKDWGAPTYRIRRSAATSKLLIRGKRFRVCARISIWFRQDHDDGGESRHIRQSGPNWVSPFADSDLLGNIVLVDFRSEDPPYVPGTIHVLEIRSHACLVKNSRHRPHRDTKAQDCVRTEQARYCYRQRGAPYSAEAPAMT